MPRTLASLGEENIIRHIGGPQEVRQHLADLGFSVGSTVMVVCSMGGNLIVSVKESRVAVSYEMAAKILV